MDQDIPICRGDGSSAEWSECSVDMGSKAEAGRGEGGGQLLNTYDDQDVVPPPPSNAMQCSSTCATSPSQRPQSSSPPPPLASEVCGRHGPTLSTLSHFHVWNAGLCTLPLHQSWGTGGWGDGDGGRRPVVGSCIPSTLNSFIWCCWGVVSCPWIGPDVTCCSSRWPAGSQAVTVLACCMLWPAAQLPQLQLGLGRRGVHALACMRCCLQHMLPLARASHHCPTVDCMVLRCCSTAMLWLCGTAVLWYRHAHAYLLCSTHSNALLCLVVPSQNNLCTLRPPLEPML